MDTYPQPNFSEFARTGVRVYAAYPGDTEGKMSDATALNRDDYGKIVKSAHYEFQFAPHSHWIYETVDVREYERVLWFRRPTDYVRKTQDYTFPWTLEDTFTLFDVYTRIPLYQVRVQAYGTKGSTGYVIVEIVDEY